MSLTEKVAQLSADIPRLSLEALRNPLANNESVLRILRQKIRFAGIGEPGRYGRHTVLCPAHRALSGEASQKSTVLLKNDPIADGRPLLPLDPAQGRIALIGKLAVAGNIGDHGSTMVLPPAIVMAWYTGMEGGHGMADILFGMVNPSGKILCVFPRSTDQLPFFVSHTSASRRLWPSFCSGRGFETYDTGISK